MNNSPLKYASSKSLRNDHGLVLVALRNYLRLFVAEHGCQVSMPTHLQYCVSQKLYSTCRYSGHRYIMNLLTVVLQLSVVTCHVGTTDFSTRAQFIRFLALLHVRTAVLSASLLTAFSFLLLFFFLLTYDAFSEPEFLKHEHDSPPYCSLSVPPIL